MLNALLSGLNFKRLFMAIAAVFAFILVSDMYIHGTCLASMYKETPSLWRTEEEMKSFMGWMLLGQFIIAKFFVLIYAKGYQGGGIAEGFRFWLLIGPFSVAPFLIQYAVTPISCSLVLSWMAVGLFQTFVCALTVSAIYRR